MQITDIIDKEETVLWRDKPSVACTIWENILGFGGLFCLFWTAMDVVIILLSRIGLENFDLPMPIVIVFVLVHLTPVYIGIGVLIRNAIESSKAEFVITDKNIYKRTGAFAENYIVKPLEELSVVNIHRSFLNTITGTGDVIFEGQRHSKSVTIDLYNVADYQGAYKILKAKQDELFKKIKDSEYLI